METQGDRVQVFNAEGGDPTSVFFGRQARQIDKFEDMFDL